MYNTVGPVPIYICIANRMLTSLQRYTIPIGGLLGGTEARTHTLDMVAGSTLAGEKADGIVIMESVLYQVR